MDSSSSLSTKSRDTFLDLITSSISEEDKHKLIHEYHQKNSLLNSSLLETYLSTQPILFTLFLLLLFLSLSLFCLSILVTTCRCLGKCGGKRYQPHPSSSHRFLFLLLSFLISWILLASSSFNFILSSASYWGQKNPSQLISVHIMNPSIDYPDYDRGKRESVLTTLFNDPDYDFDKVDDYHDNEKKIETTTMTSFIQETTRGNVPIGSVFIMRNEDINEKGNEDKKIMNNGEDDEEYIEGDDEEDEDDNESPSQSIHTIPSISSTTSIPSTTQSIIHSTIPSSSSSYPSNWVDSIGETQEWKDIIKKAEHLQPFTTRKINIYNITISPLAESSGRLTTIPTTVTTVPSTTVYSTTVPSTTVPSTTVPSTTVSSTTLPPTTVRSRTISTTTQSITSTSSHSSSSIHHRFISSPSTPSTSSFNIIQSSFPSSSSSSLPDYISISDGEEAIPISIGHINTKSSSKSGYPNLSLSNHHRQFESLQSQSFRSFNRFISILLGLILSFSTLPSLLLVVLGSMNYGGGNHPMDRSKISDRIGFLSVIMGLSLLFFIPLLLLYSSIGLLFSHTHHSLCPILQPPADNLEDILLIMEGCSRIQIPLIRMWQSSLLASISAIPIAVLLLQLSNYFLRMRREHYWIQSDCNLI